MVAVGRRGPQNNREKKFIPLKLQAVYLYGYRAWLAVTANRLCSI